ncbi:putative tetratricopeptide-like helical domain superfamily [Helianthus anomalus]
MSFRRTPHSFPQPSTSSASKNATKLSSLLQKSIPKPQPPITFKPPTTNPFHYFDYMILLQPIPPISQFNQLLNSVPNSQLKIILFRKINHTHLPISPNFITLNIVLNCYCHLNELGFAFGLFGLILKKGFVPDSVCYTSLIKGLLKKNQIFEAVRLFRKMVLLGSVSYTNVSYTYGALISGLCRVGDVDTAIRFHEDVVSGGKMGCLGFVCKPSGVCYSVLIDNLCKNGRVSKAKELFMEMRMRRISPDVVAFSSLIRGLCFMDLREAKRLFVEMVNEGVRPSVTVFNLLVHVLCKDRRLNEASVLFEFMVRKGEKLDSLSYNTLMHGYCLEGKIDEAKELYVSMLAKGIEPDVQIHNVLIDGYIKVRRVEEALRIFKQMVCGTIKPNVVTYNVLLTGVLQKGDVLTARKLFDEMPLYHLTPSLCTYNILLSGLCKNDRVSQALDLLQALESNGTELGIKVYNSVIDGLCKSGRMETAYDIYTKLSSKGLKPTVVTYTIMIHGFCKTGQLKKADSLFFEMIENKCAPNVVTFNAFMRKGSNMAPKVVELVKKTVERKVTPDASTLSLMVDLLSKDEKYKKYFDTLRTFLEVG